MRSAVRDFTPSGVRRSLEESLARLRLDRVDRLLLHDPQNAEDGGVAAYRELEEMREEGLTDAIGIGINQNEYARPFVGEHQLDVILLAGRWTLLDRSASAWLLPRCRDLGIDVAAAGVFNTGVLADPDSPDARFDYAPASQQIRERARRIRQFCTAYGVSLPAAAIQYPFTDPAVTSVIIGAATPEQVRANTESLEHAAPEALWAALATGIQS